MKRDDYLKHLDRAFTKTPPELTASVEEAFQKGEEAMKQRHKIMTALSVAAAVAVLCAALALAAGTMLKPRRDSVVAARGKWERPSVYTPVPETTPQPEQALYYATKGGVYYHTDVHCMGMMNAVPITEADALAAGKQPCPVCVTGEAASEESAAEEAQQTLNAEIAVDRVKHLDEKSANAQGFWVYLSSEPNRAWVFYATDFDDREASFEGGAWFLGEQAVSLGYSRDVSDWLFCTPKDTKGSMFYGDKESYALDGEPVAYGSELFASVTRTTDGVNRVHVWKVGEDGKVIEVDTGDRLCGIGASGGALFGLTEKESGDRCFLREYDGQLYQVCGQPEEISAVERLSGGAALLDELHENGFTVTDCLYRSMGADTEAEVVTVNLEQDGKPYHVYLFRETVSEELDCERGWDDDIDVLTGVGSIVVDAGLPTVTSGGIEATREGRVRDARMRLINTPTPGPQSEEWTETMSRTTPEPTPEPEEYGIEENEVYNDSRAAVYYATMKGAYYHEAPHCSGMKGALPWTFEAIWRENELAPRIGNNAYHAKQPCPVCVGKEPPVVNVYATPKGRYYHIIQDCSGMKNATAWYSAEAAEEAGKTRCPVCLPDGDNLCWATPAGQYYHSKRECMGMKNARIYMVTSAQRQGKRPCPVCSGKEAEAGPVPEEYGALQVYYTPQGYYYHGDAQCSGMHNAGAHTLAEAVDVGKACCPVCQPGEPDEIHMFRKVFGCGLEELFPDARYAFTLRDAQTGVREWMLCYPGDSGATYGTPVTMEDWTIREGSDLLGHVGQTVPRMSVWTNADNALTVWRCAPEPLHGMLEAAEAALRDGPEMMVGIKSTPLEWLTRAVVTFDGAGEDPLAVTLWFEGQAATTTFRWVRDEDGAYRMPLPEAGEG